MSNRIDRLRAARAERDAIEREIGAGGMATVYLAQDLKHDRRVAVKVLRPELAAALGPDRFPREIKTLARLQHPHILPLLDSGEADGFLFYTMPLVDGESLRDRIDRGAEAEAVARNSAAGWRVGTPTAPLPLGVLVPAAPPLLPLDAPPVSTPQKLSALWASLTLCYIYYDYFELYQPGKLQSILDGRMGPMGPTTQGVLLFASVLLAIPALMVALSLLLPARTSRVLNLAFGVLFTVIMLLLIPRAWRFYQFYAVVEAGITVVIVWMAWRWPRAVSA